MGFFRDRDPIPYLIETCRWVRRWPRPGRSAKPAKKANRLKRPAQKSGPRA